MKRVVWAIFIISLLIPVLSLAGEADRIAIASEGKTSEAPVSSRTGRCPFYLIYDEKGNFVQAMDNPFQNIRGRPQGSMIDSLTFDDKGNMTGGITTPSKDERDKVWETMFSFFAQWQIKVIVAEEFGDEITRAFKARGINCIAFKGSAQAAVNRALQSAEK